MFLRGILMGDYVALVTEENYDFAIETYEKIYNAAKIEFKSLSDKKIKNGIASTFKIISDTDIVDNVVEIFNN